MVDEEQRFGVAAKERLKQLKREVDVLTLSATPIPRTLNLALAGIRDLSVIETPPEDRLPIQTRVAEASAGLVRDAILRELDRGGQVFYVHNRVETIEAQAEQLRRMLPGVRFVVGHGQMPEGALEKVMIAFADGAADVLVSTTIIESGLDIPNANTIVIDRADTLGLAQLYQLRGRVGRSSRRAYAYLLYRRRERLSDEARKRLQAIFNASELGAGFQIALSDLEIRGAGNILGGEQSGHMAAVGFDLYSRLLAEAVETRKASMEGRAPIVEAPQAVVDLPIEAHLPDGYVPDEAQKLELYRRLARARSAGDLAAFRQEVLDRYGPLPDPVARLIEVAELRMAAEAAGVASISREEGWLVVRFGAGLTRATAMRAWPARRCPACAPTTSRSRATRSASGSRRIRARHGRSPRRSWRGCRWRPDSPPREPARYLSNLTVARIASARLVSASKVVPSSESTKIRTTPSLAVRTSTRSRSDEATPHSYSHVWDCARITSRHTWAGQPTRWAVAVGETVKVMRFPCRPPVVTSVAGPTVRLWLAANQPVMPSTVRGAEKSRLPSGFVSLNCVKNTISSPGASSASSPTSPGVIARFSQPLADMVKAKPGTKSWL